MIPSYADRRSKTAAGGTALSILLGVDSVVYGVLGADQHLRAAAWHERPAPDGPPFHQFLDGLRRTESVLTQAHAQTYLAVDSFYSTLVPQRLAEDGQDRLFLLQQSPLPDDLYVTHHQSTAHKYRISYGYAARTKVWLDEHFPNVPVRPFASVLIEAARRLASDRQRLALHVQDGRVHLTFLDAEQLIYHNSFPFQTAKDFLYYVLLVYDQFGLSPETVPSYLSGTLLPESELYHLLHRYVRHLHLAAPPAGIGFGSGWDPTYAHTYYPLLASFNT